MRARMLAHLSTRIGEVLEPGVSSDCLEWTGVVERIR